MIKLNTLTIIHQYVGIYNIYTIGSPKETNKTFTNYTIIAPFNYNSGTVFLNKFTFPLIIYLFYPRKKETIKKIN